MQGAHRKRNRWDSGHDDAPKHHHRESLEDEAIASLLAATASCDPPPPNPNHRSNDKKFNRPHGATSQDHSDTYSNQQQQRQDASSISKQSPSEVDEEHTTTAALEKIKPSFALSGALAKDEMTGNVYNGVVLKFVEPAEARAPNTRWRLYVFKKTRDPTTVAQQQQQQQDPTRDDAQFLEILHISKQSAYLFGREKKVADICVEHPSLSKQHAVLQFRALPDKNDPELKVRCKPYLMDLNSTNGTFINGVRLEDARYYELRKGDVITLGGSTREYVLLTENSTPHL